VKKQSLLISIVVVWLVPSVMSVPVHSLDLQRAAAYADLIVVGRVTSIDGGANTSLEVTGGSIVPATRFQATLKVDQVFKGDPKSKELFVEFLVPEYPVGLKGVEAGQYSIFFLKANQGRWEFFDATNPDLPAVPGGEIPAGSSLDRMTAALAQVLLSPSATERDCFRALDALGSLKTTFARNLLKQSMARSSGSLRLEIARTLVAHGDAAGLPVVANALLNSVSLPENITASLAASLRGMKDPRVVPVLSKLAGSNDSRVRLGAAVALRQTASSAAIRPLSHLLNDSDRDVLYYAVSGLGEITHQDEWTPAMDEFELHEGRYLTFWRKWAESNPN
jgi:hypothetical protein